MARSDLFRHCGRLIRPGILAFASLGAALVPGRAPGCEVALVLAVDVSGSVDGREYGIQMQGLAEALRDPLIAEALVRARARVALLQWTGSGRQRVTENWIQVTDMRAARRLAAIVAAEQRVWRNFSTAIGEALDRAGEMLAPQHGCRRLIVDISGDGRNNEGVEPREARMRLAARGISVNALAIEASESGLKEYFLENVVVGPGAFVEVAEDYGGYPAAIRRKLLRELARQSAAVDEDRDAATRSASRADGAVGAEWPNQDR